jgi:hypothetical protein
MLTHGLVALAAVAATTGGFQSSPEGVGSILVRAAKQGHFQRRLSLTRSKGGELICLSIFERGVTEFAKVPLGTVLFLGTLQKNGSVLEQFCPDVPEGPPPKGHVSPEEANKIAQALTADKRLAAAFQRDTSIYFAKFPNGFGASLAPLAPAPTSSMVVVDLSSTYSITSISAGY